MATRCRTSATRPWSDSLRANNKVYLGSPYRVYTRYRFRYRQNISFGFTAEKDEGEEFFKGTQPNRASTSTAHTSSCAMSVA